MSSIKKNALFPWIIFIFLLTIIGYGCHTDQGSQNQGKEIPETAQDDPVILTAEQMKAADIRVDTIARKNMNAVVRAAGQLAVPPQNKADVNVLMGGIIRKIYVQEGENVKKGQVLALIENPDFIKLEQEYLIAENTFVFTQQEMQRQQELNAASAGRGKSLQQIEASYKSEQANILTLRKQLQDLGINPDTVAKGHLITQIPVTAPIGGTVGHISVNTGTYASVQRPMMEIIDNAKIHADLTIYEKDLFKVKTGQRVRFILTNQNNREIDGEIYGINKSFEDDTKGIIVHAVIKNANKWQLIPGMYVTGLIDVGSQTDLAVPIDAVVRSEGKDFIFVVERNDAKNMDIYFRQAEVITGITELGYVQITPVKHLKQATQIVSKGAFYILSEKKAAENNE